MSSSAPDTFDGMRSQRSTITGSVWFLVCSVALGPACEASHDAMSAELNRASVNKEIEACNRGTGDCKGLGDDFLGKSAASRTSDWGQERDPVSAKRAYQMGCLFGGGEACAAVVEYGLASSPEEAARYTIRAAYYGSKIRDSVTLAADERRAQGAADEKEAKLVAIRAEESARSAAQLQGIASVIQQTGQGVQQELAHGSSASTGTTVPENRQSRPVQTSAVPSTVKEATPPPPAQCSNIRQSCSASGPFCCKQLGTGDVTNNVACKGGQCCINSGHVCEINSDCCDAPDAICESKTVPSLCCLREGTTCVGRDAPCCSGACIPSTGKCQ